MRFWSDTSWFLILSLILGSAALAFLGDILGFKYGKQRISLFGLRPKHTSRIITAITGGLITILVLAVLSAFSQDVRTALFGMKYVQQQLLDLQFQLNESQQSALQAQESLAVAQMDLDTLRNDRLLLEQEKAELDASLRGMREESEQLKGALYTMRSEAIVMSANVLLAQTAILPESTSGDVLAEIENLKQRVRLNVFRQLSDQERLMNVSVTFAPEEEAALVEELAGAEGRHFVRALSRENVSFGEPIPVRLETGPSDLIYSEGDVIYRKAYNAQDPDFDPEEVLHSFLRGLKRQAIHDGVLPDPATNNVGTLNGEAFFGAVEDLHAIHEPVIINAVASADIYTEGPVVLQLLFEE